MTKLWIVIIIASWIRLNSISGYWFFKDWQLHASFHQVNKAIHVRTETEKSMNQSINQFREKVYICEIRERESEREREKERSVLILSMRILSSINKLNMYKNDGRQLKKVMKSIWIFWMEMNIIKLYASKVYFADIKSNRCKSESNFILLYHSGSECMRNGKKTNAVSKKNSRYSF